MKILALGWDFANIFWGHKNLAIKTLVNTDDDDDDILLGCGTM
jgi:hypothetical protein